MRDDIVNLDDEFYDPFYEKTDIDLDEDYGDESYKEKAPEWCFFISQNKYYTIYGRN